MLALELMFNSLCGPLPKYLESPGQYDLYRELQTRRRWCHSWELQDEPFAFDGRTGTACVDLNMVFSTHIFSFLLRATKKEQEQKSAPKRWRQCVFTTPKAVYSASEWKYATAGGDVQVAWDGIHD